MPRNFGVVSSLLLLLGTIPAAGQLPDNRSPISPQQVANAMAASGWKVASEQVNFLSKVTSATRDGRLQLVQVTRWQGDRLKAELRCHDPRACLPFYVLISRTVTADEPGQTSAAMASADSNQSAFEMTTEKPLLRSGDPATMTFANKGLSITMPVICLENGHRGQKIRVASADHKRFYKAEIVGPGLLKATTL